MPLSDANVLGDYLCSTEHQDLAVCAGPAETPGLFLSPQEEEDIFCRTVYQELSGCVLRWGTPRLPAGTLTQQLHLWTWTSWRRRGGRDLGVVSVYGNIRRGTK